MNNQFFQQIFFENTVKNYLLFFSILLLVFIAKKFISKILSRAFFLLFKKFYNQSSPLRFHQLLLKPIEFLIVILLVYCAINQLDYPLNEVVFRRITYIDKTEKIFTITLIEIIDKIFSFLVIISSVRIALKIVDFVAHIFEYKASLTESRMDDQMVPFLKELFKILVIITCVFVIMGAVLNMNVATIIAGLGIGGLAIALAAQDTLQNLLGSFTIFADKPFVVGDLVHIEGYDAVIEKVGFRSTVLRTLDKTLVIIPNKKMIDSPLENLTLRNLRRVEFNIGLPYSTKPDVMKKISSQIKNFINAHTKTSNDTIVVFNAFSPSSLDIKVLYYIEIVEYEIYMEIKDEINYKVMEFVLANGANFAYPTTTVYHEDNSSDMPT
ncbi:MAG: mechanosensitive ion channel family protein [Sphingobacteriales bacterium]|nr:MAG: mechanosensitive ion channel family protein [Sphingobacteriales bacterium]